jgi:hypothetical protein
MPGIEWTEALASFRGSRKRQRILALPAGPEVYALCVDDRNLLPTTV